MFSATLSANGTPVELCVRLHKYGVYALTVLFIYPHNLLVSFEKYTFSDWLLWVPL